MVLFKIIIYIEILSLNRTSFVDFFQTLIGTYMKKDFLF